MAGALSDTPGEEFDAEGRGEEGRGADWGLASIGDAASEAAGEELEMAESDGVGMVAAGDTSPAFGKKSTHSMAGDGELMEGWV